MERGEPLFFWTNKLLLLVMVAGFIAGCATGARNLPPDYSSIDAKKRLSVNDFDAAAVELTCSQIDEELKILESDYALQVQDIKGKRDQNQVAGYIGAVFFLPALLATDNSAEAKVKIENINRAKDQLYKLRAFKKCPSNSGM